MKRHGQPVDVARVVHMLASVDNNYIHGAVVGISGGDFIQIEIVQNKKVCSVFYTIPFDE